jgi:hypothetical protein
MLSADHRAAKAMMDMRLDEVQRQAEAGHLQRQAGVERYGWLSQPARRLVCQLALLLVALGGRLVRYGLPPYGSVEGAMSSQSTSPA